MRKYFYRFCLRFGGDLRRAEDIVLGELAVSAQAGTGPVQERSETRLPRLTMYSASELRHGEKVLR